MDRVHYGTVSVEPKFRGPALAAALLAIVACDAGRSRPEPVERIIVIVVDTLRGDHLSCAGGPVETPNLDALAARGVRFSRARAHIPITGPSHSSLFTGLLPSDHGVLNNAQILGDGFDTLSEMARDKGMKTAAFISLGVLKKVFGVSQGFERYDQAFDPYSWRRNAEGINQAVFPWIESFSEPPSMLVWIHYSDPHGPYTAPGREYARCTVSINGEPAGTVEANGQINVLPSRPEDGRVRVSLEPEGGRPVPKLNLWDLPSNQGAYRFEMVSEIRETASPGRYAVVKFPVVFDVFPKDTGVDLVDVHFSLKHFLRMDEVPEQYGYEVEFVDRQIGRLLSMLERRGWVEDSLIVFLSDHGEGIGEHGLGGHIHQLYDSLIHVPLMFVAPGLLPEGLVVDQPVSLVDVLPTVTELSGWETPADLRGRSLVPLMAPGGTLPGRPHVALTARPQAGSNLEAVVVDGWKLIRKPSTGEVVLFDLQADPGELHDLAPEHPERVEELHRILDAELVSRRNAGAWAELDAESRSRLEALGYLDHTKAAVTPSGSQAPPTSPDPPR